MSAAGHLLKRIQRDPQLAWFFDPLTESMAILTAEYAAQKSIDLEEFRATYYASLKFQNPREVSR